MKRYYVLTTDDGRRLGRLSLSDNLRPVPDPFAYTYATPEQARATATTYDAPVKVEEVVR